MAMPSGNVVLSDKMQFPSGAGSGVEIHHPRQWYADERDGFISWIRSEFAAANAIIDSLCHHLRAVGDQGEYDYVIGYVQQRRGSWNPVLHMQQYFPITEIMLALQQVAWRKQQRFADQVKPGGKEYKRSSFASRPGQRFEMSKESNSSGLGTQNHFDANPSVGGNGESYLMSRESKDGKVGNEARRSDDKVLPSAKPVTDASLKSEIVSSDGTHQSCTKSQAEGGKDEKTASKGTAELTDEKNATSIERQGVEKLEVSPETFSSLEMCDGKMVNVIEGLNLYNNLLDEAEVSNLMSLVNDLKTAGRCGQFRGPTFVVSKRPNRGHGRETIQLGVALSDGPPDGVNEKKVEPIPGLIQGVIDRLVSMQVMPLAPDSCLIDIFNEGDHSQPHSWPHWFGRPICMLVLTDCDMVFGRAIAMDRPGSYSGSLKLTLSSGSLVAVQGKSADFAKRAIPSIRKQRILVTFTKSVPFRTPLQGDGSSRFPHAPAPPQSSNWGQPQIRSSNHIRPKHYAPTPTTGVLSVPPILPQLAPPAQSTVPQLFIPPVPTAMTFASPMQMPIPMPPGSTSWPTPAPRHVQAPPRVLAPGTGVFLPPTGSSDNPSPPVDISSATPTEVGVGAGASETGPNVGAGSNTGKVNGNVESSGVDEPQAKLEQQDCNGTGGGGVVVASEEEKEVVDSTSSEPATKN